MNTESLKIFCTVAAELSITRAATRLGRVPSNITTRIQQLEADLGESLFIRQNKRLELSASGRQFLDYAKRLLALEEEARHVISGGLNGGQLRIGSMESTAACRLPLPLAQFHQQNPTTRLLLSTGSSLSLLDQVHTGKLDCAFVALPASLYEPDQLSQMGIKTEIIWQEELQLLLPEHDRHATNSTDIKTRSLAAFTQGCSYRNIAEQWLDIPANSGWSIQEMNSYHAMIACVSAGSCVALLPKYLIESMPISSLPLGRLPITTCDTLLIYRENYHVPAFSAFKACITPLRSRYDENTKMTVE
ncbi:LysR family transcriptional regulator [Providencia rettgeri]|uniref:LysR family transcriptional regulator n=1 Tax=Providencia rettgeri TaxID=587 RepID=UPI0034E09CC1